MGMQVINSKGNVSPDHIADLGSRESAARFAGCRPLGKHERSALANLTIG